MKKIFKDFTSLSLPYKDPLKANPNLRAFERTNGSFTLSIEPARLVDALGQVEWGFPFGKYPAHVIFGNETDSFYQTLVLRQMPAWLSDRLVKELAEINRRINISGRIWVSQISAISLLLSFTPLIPFFARI